jgi:hypothetical protein
MVPLSKSGVRKHRGFESHPLRQNLARIASRRPASDLRWGDGRQDVEDAGTLSRGERSPSGLWRRTGNAVRGNPSRVRIPPSPPILASMGSRSLPGHPGGPVTARGTESRYTAHCRARRGTSGALYLQSAPAGLNSLSRSPFSDAAASSDVEDRVPRSGDSRTVSGPEGSSTKRSSPGAADRPGPSRSSRWARGRADRQGVHGN